MIACSCPKCSTYGNASYCINAIIDESREDIKKFDKRSLFWLKFSIWSAGFILALPLIIAIFKMVYTG
jgi:hypothetical protein